MVSNPRERDEAIMFCRNANYQISMFDPLNRMPKYLIDILKNSWCHVNSFFFTFIFIFVFNGTNNEAEYSGVLLGINKIIELGIRNANVHFLSDNQLVVNQLSGRWRIKDPRMRSYVDEIRSLLDQYEIEASFTYIPREKNLDANLLTLAAIDGKHVDETLIKES